MVIRTSNAEPFLVIGEDGSTRTGIRVEVYSPTAPNTLLAVLPDTWDRQWSDLLVGAGSASFKIASNHPALLDQPDLLAYGNIVRFVLDEVARFAMTIEAKDITQASPSGDSAKVMTVSGRGVLAKLQEAVVYPAGGVSGEPVRAFVGAAPGQAMAALIDEAKARGALTGITRSFSGTLDTNGAPWLGVLNQTERAGTDLERVSQRIAETVADVYMSPSLQLSMYNTRGIDRSLQLPLLGPAVLRPGDNVVELSRSEDGAIRNTLLIETPTGWSERVDGASVSLHRRREAFLSLGNMDDSDAVTRTAEAVFIRSANPAAQITMRIQDKDGQRPYHDWNVGDWVLAPDLTEELVSVRVRGITVSEDAAGNPVFTPELATAQAELETRLERWLAAMSKGTVGGVAASVAEPVETTDEVRSEINDIVDFEVAEHNANVAHFQFDQTGVADKDTLRFDSVAGEWVPLKFKPDPAMAPTNNQVLAYEQASGLWKPATGAVGVSSPPQWMVDIATRPDAPTVFDDEFSAGTLDPKWTQVLTSGTINPVFASGAMSAIPAGQTASHMAALLQPMTGLTTAPVTIEMAFRMNSYNGNYLFCGPVFTAAVTTSQAWWLAMYAQSGGPTLTTRRAAANFSDLGTVVGTDRVGTGLNGSTVFLRARWDGANTYSAWMSRDGKHWWAFNNTNPRPAGGPNPPTHFGIGFSTWGASVGHQVVIEYFRVNP